MMSVSRESGATVTTTRRRLRREERRAQLLELGRQAVANSSFDELSLEQVAVAAGISRGLLFHYFPTRRDFVVAIAERGAADLLDRIDPTPDGDPLTRLRRGLDAYVDTIMEQPRAYVSLVRGAQGGDPDMQAVADRARAEIAHRILRGLQVEPAPRLVELAVRGWLAFVEEAVIAWLEDDRDVSRDELLVLFERQLVTAVLTVLGPAAAARLGLRSLRERLPTLDR